jgi:hypothetical protein
MMSKNQVRLAVAATLALAGGLAQAATLSVVAPGATVHSRQGNIGNTAAVALNDVTVTLGADYTLNDSITLTLAGATLGTANPTFACADAVGSPAVGPDAIISYVTGTGNTRVYRMTQKEVSNTTGLVCTISGLTVVGSSLVNATTVSLSYSALTAVSNLPLDAAGTNTVTVATTADQFTSTVNTALNGIVDVNNGRKIFTVDDDGAVAGTQDNLVVTLANNTTLEQAATLNSVAILINGDFTFTDLDSDGCGDDALTGTLTASTGTIAVAANCQSATVTNAAAAAFTIQATGATTGKVLTAPQTFAGTSTFSFDPVIANQTPDLTDSDSLAYGAWTLNGFSAFVPYMPYGTNISQIIYLTNKSTQAGAISVTAFNEAGATCTFSAGNVGAGRTLQIAGAVKTGLEGCAGFLTGGTTGRVAMTITANIPGSLAEVYSAYNVGGTDRGTVVNSTNGRITVSGTSTTGSGL